MHILTPHRLKKAALLGSVTTALAMLTAQQASAFTAFETANDKLSISGRIAYDYQWNKSGTTKNGFGNGGTRVNVVFEHSLPENWTFVTRWEEGLDPLYTTHNGDNHFNRQRFFGFSNPEYGTITAGRQDSIIYDFVDLYTDQPYFYADYTEASWSGSDINGSIMRPSHTLKYVVTKGDWTLGAMYGWSLGDINNHLVPINGNTVAEETYGSHRKNMVEIGAKYQPGYNLTFSGAYHYARVNSADDNYSEPNANAWELGANWTPGNWYLSVVGGRSRNVVAANAVNNHYGAFGQYTFPAVWGDGNDLLVYGLYDLRTDQRSQGDKSRQTLGTAARLFHRKFIVAVEHVWLNDKSTTDGSDLYHHDSTVLLTRYNF